jgi:histidine kinase/DNA gyrase B/HSP90-like ATPase
MMRQIAPKGVSMAADQQAIILFRQGAQLEHIVKSMAVASSHANLSIEHIDDYEHLLDLLKTEHYICAIANVDEDPELLEMLKANEGAAATLFPVLFFTDGIAEPGKRDENSIGVYDVILRSWVSKHTLPRFIASCIHEHAARLTARRSDDAARITTRLLALISHEIKVPLETLRMTQANLLKMEMSEQAKMLASQSERAIAYLCEYVDGFIEHARLEKKEVRSLAEEFCVKSMIQEVIDLVWPKANIKGVAIDLKMPAVDLLHAYGDKKRLRQILINILSNAIRYTDDGKVEINISAGDGLQFDFRDTGVGMTPKRLNDVFTSDIGRTMASNGCADAGGLGIGVALCRKLIKILDGDIVAESEEGRGTTVRVSVPYKVYLGGVTGEQCAV